MKEEPTKEALLGELDNLYHTFRDARKLHLGELLQIRKLVTQMLIDWGVDPDAKVEVANWGEEE